MKLIKLLMIFLVCAFAVSSVSGQSNAYISVLTQNSGLVNQGGTVFIEVTVGNTGPMTPIGVNKVRAQLSLPSAICTALPNVQQTGLPPGWTITVNTGGVITVCNGSDVIAVGAARTILIKVQGNNLGGPSTVTGNLLFSSGTSCTTPGTLPGDNTADNSSTSSIQVVPAAQCIVAVSAAAGNIPCFGGTTTLTASSGQATNVEYSLNGGAFQTGTTFTVPAGTYTVVARKISDNTCTATSNTVTVMQPGTALSATASSTTTSTIGGNDGTATANPAGGTPGYTYSWSPGGQTTQTATALTAGTYTVTVTDANGCIITATTSVSDPVVTPLTLIDFNAKLANCQLALNWITDNEINTDRFEVERASLNNSNWVSTGVVVANGNTSTKVIYQFIDRSLNISPEEVLYRLKMIDKNGDYKYSKILHVLNDCKNNIQVDVYPNPVRKGKLYIKLSGAGTSAMEVVLISLTGQLVLKNKINNGINYLNISNIAAGEYVLSITDTNGFEVKVKVFIQN